MSAILGWLKRAVVNNPLTSFPGAIAFLVGAWELFVGPIPGIKEDPGTLMNAGQHDLIALVQMLVGYGLIAAKDAKAEEKK